MRNKLVAFVGGLISFVLILVTYTGISGVFIYHGMEKAHNNYFQSMKDDAQQMAVQLADAISRKDPLKVGRPRSERNWKQHPQKRLRVMGEAVFNFPGERHLVEAFFLSKEGELVSTNRMANYRQMEQVDNIHEKYNTSFFHRGTILARAQGSVRMVPKEVPLKYEVILGEKNLDKYRLTMNSTTALPISAITLFVAKYINKKLESPVMDATAPIFDNRDKVVGTAHYLVHLLPFYAFLEDYTQAQMQNYLWGLVAITLMALIVIMLLLLSSHKKEYIPVSAQGEAWLYSQASPRMENDKPESETASLGSSLRQRALQQAEERLGRGAVASEVSKESGVSPKQKSQEKTLQEKTLAEESKAQEPSGQPAKPQEQAQASDNDKSREKRAAQGNKPLVVKNERLVSKEISKDTSKETQKDTAREETKQEPKEEFQEALPQKPGSQEQSSKPDWKKIPSAIPVKNKRSG